MQRGRPKLSKEERRVDLSVRLRPSDLQFLEYLVSGRTNYGRKIDEIVAHAERSLWSRYLIPQTLGFIDRKHRIKAYTGNGKVGRPVLYDEERRVKKTLKVSPKTLKYLDDSNTATRAKLIECLLYLTRREFKNSYVKWLKINGIVEDDGMWNSVKVLRRNFLT